MKSSVWIIRRCCGSQSRAPTDEVFCLPAMRFSPISLHVAIRSFAPFAFMSSFLQSDTFHLVARIIVGSVWVFHGLYSKIFDGIPRHRMIVGKILGAANAGIATKIIGLLEVLLGVWAFTEWQPTGCAAVQSVAIVAMNSLEIARARELLISVIGMVLLNLGFLALVWSWALFAGK